MDTLRDWLQKAQDEHFAIGAFNVANLETLKAVVNAAQVKKSPVIIEASSGESEFVGIRALRYLINAYVEETGIPIFLNLDHAHDIEAVLTSIDTHFDLVHFDGSEFAYEDNISALNKIVLYAKEHAVLVEGEMDHIQGSSADHRKEAVESVLNESMYTDPDKAAVFVEQTGVDILATFFGNVHGIYAQAPVLDFDRVKMIRQSVPCFLSMHGGSGIAADDVREAVSLGITKVNVNSEMRIAFRETLENELKESDEVAMYKIMPDVITAVQTVVEDKIDMFGSAGKL